MLEEYALHLRYMLGRESNVRVILDQSWLENIQKRGKCSIFNPITNVQSCVDSDSHVIDNERVFKIVYTHSERVKRCRSEVLKCFVARAPFNYEINSIVQIYFMNLIQLFKYQPHYFAHLLDPLKLLFLIKEFLLFLFLDLKFECTAVATVKIPLLLHYKKKRKKKTLMTVLLIHV